MKVAYLLGVIGYYAVPLQYNNIDFRLIYNGVADQHLYLQLEVFVTL